MVDEQNFIKIENFVLFPSYGLDRRKWTWVINAVSSSLLSAQMFVVNMILALSRHRDHMNLL